MRRAFILILNLYVINNLFCKFLEFATNHSHIPNLFKRKYVSQESSHIPYIYLYYIFSNIIYFKITNQYAFQQPAPFSFFPIN